MRKRHIMLSMISVLFCGPVCPLQAQDAETVLALKAEPQSAQWAQSWWMPRHEAKLAEAKERQGQIDLLFVGDSITHGWENGGKAVWDEFYGKRKAFNLGFSGDRTEHVLWRFRHGALEGLSPKVAVVMIGTNNTGHRQDKAADTLSGVQAIVDEMKQRLPRTKILVLAVFPRESTKDQALRQLNERINESLKTFDQQERVSFLNLNSVFLHKDGKLPQRIMPDLLHPNALGYRLWARSMEPTLQKLLGEKSDAPEPTVIHVWPNTAPGDICDEAEGKQADQGDNITRITNVSVPTLAIYPARSRRRNTPAVLICPGGGYSILAYNLEGTEIAQWLNSIGITAAILKYRVPKNRAGAFQDAQRGMRLLRHQAEQWQIDPERIGVLGFSAGAHLSARLSTAYAEQAYTPVDAADQISCRPDFTVLVYPAYLGNKDWELAEDIVVTAQTPPAFIVQTQDDRRLFPSSTAYHEALCRAGVPAEIHLYAAGGHGYGMRPSAYPVSDWPKHCAIWQAGLE